MSLSMFTGKSQPAQQVELITVEVKGCEPASGGVGLDLNLQNIVRASPKHKKGAGGSTRAQRRHSTRGGVTRSLVGVEGRARGVRARGGGVRAGSAGRALVCGVS